MSVLRTIFPLTIFSFILLMLVACGGGGGSSSDTTPNAFSFNAVVDTRELETEFTSNTVTVSGIDSEVAISVSGGQYQIGNGAKTSANGRVSNGDQVRVFVTSAAEEASTQTATLNIGGVTANFTVTTLDDLTGPVAEILFPPSYSMTEESTVFVRGTASDAKNTVTKVQVNGVDVEPVSEGDYSSWTVTVPLTAMDENPLVVTTEDSLGNVEALADQHNIRQANFDDAFPTEAFDLQIMLSITYDENRNWLLMTDNGGVFHIDLSKKDESSFGLLYPSVLDPDDDSLGIFPSPAILLQENILFINDGNKFLEIDISSGDRRILTSSSIPENGNQNSAPFDGPATLIQSPTNDKELLVHDRDNGLISLNKETGVRNVISSTGSSRGNEPVDPRPVEFSDTFNTTANGLLYDDKFVTFDREEEGFDDEANQYVEVDLVTGERTYPFADIVRDNSQGFERMAIYDVVEVDGDEFLVAQSDVATSISKEFPIVLVNPRTGNFQEYISTEQLSGNNPIFSIVHDITDFNALPYHVIASWSAIYALDFESKNKVVIAKSPSASDDR